MSAAPSETALFCGDYARRLSAVLREFDWAPVAVLAEALLDCWRSNRQVYLCGNGGSAGNAIHLANDFNYGISKSNSQGLRIIALPANSSIVTCVANDMGYDEIFSQQIRVHAEKGDLVIILSGSGNSPNIL